MIEPLLQTDLGLRVESRLSRDGDELHIPHLLDVEVAHAMRRLVKAGDLGPERVQQAFDDLMGLGLHRHPHHELLARIWEMRENLSAYDAVYVALAEALPAVLVTCDRPLGLAPGHVAAVEVVR